MTRPDLDRFLADGDRTERRLAWVAWTVVLIAIAAGIWKVATG